jgi:hypothetical protein
MRSIFFVLVTASALAIGCSSSTSPTDYTGAWSGTTAQGKTITFSATNGNVSNLSMGYRFQNGGCLAEGSFSTGAGNLIAISAGGFTYTSSSIGTVRGTFASSSSASGTATLTTGCGTTTTTWNANKS